MRCQRRQRRRPLLPPINIKILWNWPARRWPAVWFINIIHSKWGRAQFKCRPFNVFVHKNSHFSANSGQNWQKSQNEMFRSIFEAVFEMAHHQFSWKLPNFAKSCHLCRNWGCAANRFRNRAKKIDLWFFHYNEEQAHFDLKSEVKVQKIGRFCVEWSQYVSQFIFCILCPWHWQLKCDNRCIFFFA